MYVCMYQRALNVDENRRRRKLDPQRHVFYRENSLCQRFWVRVELPILVDVCFRRRLVLSRYANGKKTIPPYPNPQKFPKGSGLNFQRVRFLISKGSGQGVRLSIFPRKSALFSISKRISKPFPDLNFSMVWKWLGNRVRYGYGGFVSS